MTAPARPGPPAADVPRRGVLTAVATAGLGVLVALGIAGCTGDGAGPTSGDGPGSTSRSPTAPAEDATTSRRADSPEETDSPGETDSPAEAGTPGDAGSPDETGTSARSDPSAGRTPETVPGVPGEVAGPVPLDATGDFGDGVEARLSRIETVEAEATLPGEVSGTAVAVTVEALNGRRDTIDLDHVTVDLATGDGASVSPVFDPEREPLAGDLGAGGTRSGTYVFTLATEERGDVSVRVRYSADTPTVVFTGSVPDA